MAVVLGVVSAVTVLAWIGQYAMVPVDGFAAPGTDPHRQRGDVTRAGAKFTAGELRAAVLVAALTLVLVLFVVALVRSRRAGQPGGYRVRVMRSVEASRTPR